MIAFLIRRLLQSILVIVGLVVVVFFVTNLLGDPARLMLRPEATEEDVQALRAELEEAVRSGELSPVHAADRLLAAFLQS